MLDNYCTVMDLLFQSSQMMIHQKCCSVFQFSFPFNWLSNRWDCFTATFTSDKGQCQQFTKNLLSVNYFSFLFSQTQKTSSHTLSCVLSHVCILLLYYSKGGLLRNYCHSEPSALWETYESINACSVLYCVKPLYRHFSIPPWDRGRDRK